MITVTVKNCSNDIIKLKVSGVTSEHKAETAAFKATFLEEGPVCTDSIEEKEDGSFIVALKGVNPGAFAVGQQFII